MVLGNSKESTKSGLAILPVEQAARPTTIVEASRLAKRLGMDLTIATETFQHTGSFKFRAAYNLVSKVPQQKIIAASSGNFGQAIACASAMLGKSCTIVMPETSARVKIDAVREYGGMVDLINVSQLSRAARVEQLSSDTPDAYIASAYDDPFVIEGNSTLARELAVMKMNFDIVVAPLGGGGLTSGLIKGFREAGSAASVWGAEPLMANDGARSLRAGALLANESEPQTIADGARTVSLGRHNWAILKDGLSGIVEVGEDQIKEAMRLLFSLANLKSEPTGALSLGALLTEPERFRGRKVCCVISGGNVDAAVYQAILAG